MNRDCMVRVYQRFSDWAILTTASAKLSWSRIVEIIKIDDKAKVRLNALITENLAKVKIDG